MHQSSIVFFFFFFLIRGSAVARPDQLEREARRLGRSLVRTGDEDDDEDFDDDYDDELVAMEATDVRLTPLLRSVSPCDGVLTSDPSGRCETLLLFVCAVDADRCREVL